MTQAKWIKQSLYSNHWVILAENNSMVVHFHLADLSNLSGSGSFIFSLLYLSFYSAMWYLAFIALGITWQDKVTNKVKSILTQNASKMSVDMVRIRSPKYDQCYPDESKFHSINFRLQGQEQRTGCHFIKHKETNSKHCWFKFSQNIGIGSLTKPEKRSISVWYLVSGVWLNYDVVFLCHLIFFCIAECLHSSCEVYWCL